MASEPIHVSFYTPVGSHMQLTGLSTDKHLIVPQHANGLLIQAISQNVRFKLDGTAAVSTVGFQIRAGDPPQLFPLHSGAVVHFIEEAASATIQAQGVRV
jgi:hypothetical protein